MGEPSPLTVPIRHQVGEVGERVPEGRHFPIKHRNHPGGMHVDDQVAEPVVAVHQGCVGTSRQALLQFRGQGLHGESVSMLVVLPLFQPSTEPSGNEAFGAPEVAESNGGGIDCVEIDEFIAFHNEHHRYSIHGGTTPNQIWQGRLRNPRPTAYHQPAQLPAQGRIEVVRYVGSNRRIDLFGQTHPRRRKPDPPLRHRHHQGPSP